MPDIINVVNLILQHLTKNGFIEYKKEQGQVQNAMVTEISFKKFVGQIELAPENKNDVLRFIVEKQWKGFQYEWLLKEQSEFKKIVQNGTGQREQLFGRQTADDVRKNLSGWDGFN